MKECAVFLRMATLKCPYCCLDRCPATLYCSLKASHDAAELMGFSEKNKNKHTSTYRLNFIVFAQLKSCVVIRAKHYFFLFWDKTEQEITMWAWHWDTAPRWRCWSSLAFPRCCSKHLGVPLERSRHPSSPRRSGATEKRTDTPEVLRCRPGSPDSKMNILKLFREEPDKP